MGETTMVTQWVVSGIALAAGVSFALIVWLFSRLAAGVPEEDRTWRDPPPMLYRLLWWPVHWVSHYLDAFLSPGRRGAIQARLRLAGVDFALTPAQYLAGCLVWGGVAGLWGLWFAGNFQLPVWPAFLGGFVLGAVYPVIWLGDRIELRRRQALKALPFMLDLITLCVESGLNLTGAISQAVEKGPPGALRDEFARFLRDVRAGKPRADALREMATRMDMPAVASFVATLIQAETTGMHLGPMLRAQADQRRTERFARAEKLAMEAPVKLLFPLLFFIFPCVFVILMFPIVVKFLAAGF
jgi:tight adherence protein C